MNLVEKVKPFRNIFVTSIFCDFFECFTHFFWNFYHFFELFFFIFPALFLIQIAFLRARIWKKKVKKNVPSHPKTDEKRWVFWSNRQSLLGTSLQMAISPISKSGLLISSFSAWRNFMSKFRVWNGTFLKKRKSVIPSMNNFSVRKELFFQKLFPKKILFGAKNRSKKSYA